ncbi:uncharacterized protein [Temnothorax longispinosus]|uniref:uncharacterized protein isoform X2 n=1 Tax=Temnothorax longispinosus TaxID=300112 RepID=UPI003A994EFD
MLEQDLHAKNLRRTVIVDPKRKRSKIWNYFEKLKPLLVKCTTCKKEIKVSHPKHYTKVMRMHLSRHGIFLDNDTHTLPDDLKQYYSELPGYKAKCNNCGETISFSTNIGSLRKHLKRHSTIIQSRDETVMVPRKKRSELWNYFEELNPLLVKCTTCKKEIKVSHSATKAMRMHLSRHGIFLDNDTHTLPDDLKQYYSELPEYKAKCNNCGETVSFLTNITNLRKHLRRHSTRIQSPDETVIVDPKRKRSKIWNYFEKLKPLLVKCTTCKREIKVSHRTCYTSVMRMHLSRHGIFLDKDILPDNLRQCYSELPGYKAKCNNCGVTVSFLSRSGNLRNHLRRHSTITQNRDETVIMAPTKRHSKLWNYFEELKPLLVKCTTCKKEIKVSHPKHYTKVMRMHLSRHGIFLNNDIHTLPDDLKQYYSELPGYKAKCKDCDETLSFLSNMENLRKHLRSRHSTTIQSRDETVIMAPKRKRSKFWNYFEKLKPLLVKCTTCKREIKVSTPRNYSTVMKRHLSKHGIFLDNGTLSLPDDLKQYYSKLPEYKAKCNNCGKTLSFLTNFRDLRTHLRKHSTSIQSPDETVIMAPKRKRSQFWNYFEKLKPLLVKCTTCKREIKVSHQTRYIKLMRLHLSRHGIFADNDTHTIPDNLKQYYSELPGYKAKCNNCGETVSFLTNVGNLRKHLRRHSTITQSRDETTPRRRHSKLWNYFEELKPLQIKCTTCKKEMKVSHPNHYTKVMRMHLSRHGIFLDNDTRTIPDNLKQCYSKLPGCKAKCNNCGKIVSFLKDFSNLGRHLRRHSTITQSRDETTPRRRHSKLWNYFEELKPLQIKCTTCKKEMKVSHPNHYTKVMRMHLSRHGIFLDNDTLSLPDDLKQYYSELPRYKAKCNNCGKAVSFLTNIGHLRKHLRRHSTTIQSRDETKPTKKSSKLWNYFEELKPTLVKCTTCKGEIKVSTPRNYTTVMKRHLSKHGIFHDNDTRTIPDNLKQCYSKLPGCKAKCNNCGETVSFSHLRVHLRKHSTITQNRDETTPTKKRSKLWNYFEELKPLLVKCTTCKREIKVSHPTKYTNLMRMHLSRHGIFADNDTHTIPDDLKQYYSELPGYKAKCNNCGKAVSFLTDYKNLRRHLRRHSTITQSRDETVIMGPKRKRSQFWNYFEKLKPLLVKCTTCKREIKVPHETRYIKLMRLHLSRHGIFADTDTHTIPDDLKQYYSELPGYKAKCNNCGKAVSSLTNYKNLRRHLRRHSTITQSRDETVIMAPKRKRSQFWNYFEKLKPLLVKCTTCKREIKVSHETCYIKLMRLHLSRHGIFADTDTHTIPDDLKQYYSELPGYKAKCNNCGKAVSFLTNYKNLRRHLRRHSTITQSRDETVIMAPKRKRSQFWNYFEKLKPLLVKCTTCKREIKVSHETRYIKLMRLHLSRHGIFADNDTHTIPDDLKQYYSELPGYKAKCNNCGKAVSFLTDYKNLRRHLRRHSTITQSRDETDIMAPKRKRSKFWNYFEELKPLLVKCTTCKREIKVSHKTRYIKLMRLHLSRHGIFADNDTHTIPDDLKQYYSELPGYKAKCNNCGKAVSFLTRISYLRVHLRRHSTITQSRDETVIMALKRKRSKLWNYFEELKPTLVKCTTCKKEIKISHPSYRIQTFRAHLLNVHGIFLDNDTRTLPDKLRQYYSELPGYKAKCNNCGVTVSFLSSSNLRKHLRRHSTITQSRDEPNTSSSTSRVMDPNAELQSQETINLALQSCEQSRKEIRTRDGSFYRKIYSSASKSRTSTIWFTRSII